MDIIEGVRAFLATAQAGSFTAAADQLRISNKLVSKYIATLEEQLGARLFFRTTRNLHITPAGEEYLPRAQALLNAHQEFIASTENDLPQKLRITAPTNFGEDFVIKAIAKFQKQHPSLFIDVKITDEMTNLAEGAFDLAIRISNLNDSSLISKKMGRTRLIIAASPQYLAEHPPIKTPEDLTNHDLIIDTNVSSRGKIPYVLDGELRAIKINGRISVNGARATASLALAHNGIMISPDIFIRQSIMSGELVEILSEYSTAWLPIHMLHLPSPIKNPLLKQLMDFLSEEFSNWWDQPPHIAGTKILCARL